MTPAQWIAHEEQVERNRKEKIRASLGLADPEAHRRSEELGAAIVRDALRRLADGTFARD